MRVYVAGPYTHPDPVENTHKAIGAADALAEVGHIPFVPHLTLLWHMVSPHPLQFWYDHDMGWLEVCDALLRLPGPSTGADAEVARATELGIPVYHSIDDLPEP